MKKGFITCSILTLIFSSCLSTSDAFVSGYKLNKTIKPSGIKELSENVERSFKFNLIDKFAGLFSFDKNELLSPLSLYFASANISEMVDDNSLYNQFYGFNSRDEDVAIYNNIVYLDEVNNNQSFIKFNNSIWLDSLYKGRKYTLDTLGKDRNSEVYSIRFSDDVELNKISQWVNENTNSYLTPSVQELGIESTDVFSLLNSTYYKDSWVREISTINKPFLEEGDYPYLKTTSSCYFENSKIEATSISLTFGQLQLIMPKENVLLNNAYKEILNITFDVPYNVQTSFPCFHINNNMDLNKFVFNNIFNKNIKLNKIADQVISIKKITQLSKIDVDINGISGGAVTSFTGYTSYQDEGETVILDFDKPFIFSLTDKSGFPLFVGTVCTL